MLEQSGGINVKLIASNETFRGWYVSTSYSYSGNPIMLFNKDFLEKYKILYCTGRGGSKDSDSTFDTSFISISDINKNSGQFTILNDEFCGIYHFNNDSNSFSPKYELDNSGYGPTGTRVFVNKYYPEVGSGLIAYSALLNYLSTKVTSQQNPSGESILINNVYAFKFRKPYNSANIYLIK